ADYVDAPPPEADVTLRLRKTSTTTKATTVTLYLRKATIPALRPARLLIELQLSPHGLKADPKRRVGATSAFDSERTFLLRSTNPQSHRFGFGGMPAASLSSLIIASRISFSTLPQLSNSTLSSMAAISASVCPWSRISLRVLMNSR